MKIIALIRTLNEERNIEKCCEAYQFADQILIADGGSVDRTIELALNYPKVSVSLFEKTIDCQNGIKRNPDGEHLNFLFDWGRFERADWIISQDCDQRPNLYLKQKAREIIEEANADENVDFVIGVQIFLFKSKQWFPEMSMAEDKTWRHGMWAHRASRNLKVIDHTPHYEFSLDGTTPIDLDRLNRSKIFEPPLCYMHHKWYSEEAIEEMVKYYRMSGLIREQTHPITFGGIPAKTEEWMIE